MEMLLRTRDRRVKRAAVTVAAIVGLVLSVSPIRAQNNPDETAIRQILDSEVTTWNKGDTDGYSRHFAADGTFTKYPRDVLHGTSGVSRPSRSYFQRRIPRNLAETGNRFPQVHRT
jgi:hypothetical protein